MSEQHLHIITHDVPYPADFGGVIDAFNKIKALAKLGVKINLHCYTNKRAQQSILENFCETVTYYPRTMISGFSLKLPFIVASRKDKQLLANLKKDNHPILFEGIHTTYLLQKNLLIDRKVFLRILNVENIYYSYIASHEKNIIKRLYYFTEAKLLKKYERTIANKAIILALSTSDKSFFQAEYKARSIIFLPAFLPDNFVTSLIGKGKYCLYHGNLQVNENEKAAFWLIENIFSKSFIPFVIAGNKPSISLKKSAKKYQNISIVETPSEKNMQLLVNNAQINILPSFNSTGIKLKLLNALYNGRYCLVNQEGVEGSGLNELCEVAEKIDEFAKKIITLFTQEFTQKEMQHRSTALKKLYNNEQSARMIIDMLS